MPVYAQPCVIGGQAGYAQPADAKHGLHDVQRGKVYGKGRYVDAIERSLELVVYVSVRSMGMTRVGGSRGSVGTAVPDKFCGSKTNENKKLGFNRYCQEGNWVCEGTGGGVKAGVVRCACGKRFRIRYKSVLVQR